MTRSKASGDPFWRDLKRPDHADNPFRGEFATLILSGWQTRPPFNTLRHRHLRSAEGRVRHLATVSARARGGFTRSCTLQEPIKPWPKWPTVLQAKPFR